jgi:PAS domain S-box-containing protein
MQLTTHLEDRADPGRLNGEPLHRALVELMSDWTWEMDAELRFTAFSVAGERRPCPWLQRLVGKRYDEVAPASCAPEAWREHGDALEARRPFRDLVFAIVGPDGQHSWCKLSGLPVHDAAGVFCGYRGAGRDCTAEIEAERKLRDSEERFRQLFAAASDWYWETDADLRLTYVSPNHQAGIPATSNLGKRRDEYGDTSLDPEAWREYLEQVRERRPFRDFVYREASPGADGRLHWVKTSGVPVFAPDGSFRGYRGTASDVTARVEADAKSRELQQRYHNVVENIGKALSIFNANHELVACNQAYKDLYKGSDGQSIVRDGMSFRELMEWRVSTGFWRTPPVEMENVVDGVTERLDRSAGTWAYELSDGRSMLVDHWLLPDGSRVSLWTDVTVLRAAESKRRELEAQLHHSQRLEALGRLAGGVAHDLNNALVPVLAMTKRVIDRLPAGSSERRSLELALTGGRRAGELVRQILAFSRKQAAEVSVLDLAELVREAMPMLAASVPATIRLEAAIDPVRPVLANAGQIHQVLVNLVVNAAQAIGDAVGTVSIGVQPASEPARIRLTVADTGPGMDETTQQRVFEPFFTTKEVGMGTGLGLSVVHGIVTSHGGTIVVASRPGHGTRFAVELPVAEAGEASGEESDEESSAAAAVAAPR